MWSLFKRKSAPAAPHPEHPPDLVAEARRNPGGYVYSIDPAIKDPMGDVPFCAITGWYKVDAHGEIEGAFVENEKYDAGLTQAWIAEQGTGRA